MAWHKGQRYRQGSGSWTELKSRLTERVISITGRALVMHPCPITIPQMNAMLTPPEILAHLEQAAEMAPHHFLCQFAEDDPCIEFTDPDSGIEFRCLTTLPAMYGKSYKGIRMLLRKNGGAHFFHEGANPEHCAEFRAWAMERHLTGLKVAAARKLAADLIESAANENQIHKVWPELLQYTGIPGNGAGCRFPSCYEPAKYKAPIVAANALLALCALLPADPTPEYNKSGIKAVVQWKSKKALAPWSQDGFKAD